jgi:hypothetical protein
VDRDACRFAVPQEEDGHAGKARMASKPASQAMPRRHRSGEVDRDACRFAVPYGGLSRPGLNEEVRELLHLLMRQFGLAVPFVSASLRRKRDDQPTSGARPNCMEAIAALVGQLEDATFVLGHRA